jgi:hypothetical protein
MAEETEEGHSLLQEVSRIELEGGVPIAIFYLDKNGLPNLTSMTQFGMKLVIRPDADWATRIV